MSEDTLCATDHSNLRITVFVYSVRCYVCTQSWRDTVGGLKQMNTENGRKRTKTYIVSFLEREVILLFFGTLRLNLCVAVDYRIIQSYRNKKLKLFQNVLNKSKL